MSPRGIFSGKNQKIKKGVFKETSTIDSFSAKKASRSLKKTV